MATIIAAAATKLSTTLASAQGLSSAVSLGTGVLGTISAYQTAQANKAAAANAAAVEDENRKRAIATGGVSAQDKDFENLYALSQQEVQQAGSGLKLSSASSVRARRLNRVLARRDTLRIVDDANTQGASAGNRAEAARAQSNNINPFMTAFTTGLSAAGSFISTADTINPKTRTRISGATA